MKIAPESSTPRATETRIPLSDYCPDATYGVASVLDQYDALEAYRVFDDGGLQAVPNALAAYVDQQQ
jgi:hypothetical protein